MQVLKFGGSSVANADTFKLVINIINKSFNKNGKIIVVLSALGGTTDLLLDAATKASEGNLIYKELLIKNEVRHLDLVRLLLPVNDQSSVLTLVKKFSNQIEDLCNGIYILRELSDRTKDTVLSFGELLSSKIFHAKLRSLKLNACWKDSRDLIITNSDFGNAHVDFEKTNANISAYYNDEVFDYCILPGFIAKNKEGITTTLGRGGSDYTASILGAALNVKQVEIWTDVSGMMSADPKLVNNAKIINNISYHEAMELSHFGAKVIYPPTLQPLITNKISVRIKNTFAPEEPGTLIHAEANKSANSICGISSINKFALLSLEGSGMVGIPGFSKKLFEVLSDHKINVILITQGSSEHSICVGVAASNAEKAKNVVDIQFKNEINSGHVQPLTIERDLSIIALVGDKMKNHPGISGKMFHVLGRNGINVRAIAQGSSERNISAVISSTDVKKAINVLHEDFFETTYKQINLFICGTGNVGSKLIAQLQQQQDHLLSDMRLQLRIAGIANSRKMNFNNEGIDLSCWKELLNDGEEMNINEFVRVIGKKNLRNSVFVDVTANKDVASVYPELLQKSISVVACNKIACSSSYKEYQNLKDLSREFNALFLFETNVGAGLPVIGTLNDLLRSGDKVRKIEAVLSGTLNFVFNNYNGTKSFASVVKQAQDEGYTEPDPRLDLGGTDVMRKIMILARESGQKVEMDEIINKSFMPEACMEGTVEHFYTKMEEYENHFKELLESAKKEDKKLKFVAKYEDGKGSVGLEHIGKDHDLYHLYGKDNVVLFYTNRYAEQPLVIKGAGAGAEVTASGVFADIIRAAAPSN